MIHIDDQFLAKDQNGTILNFGADGEVIELDGFIGDTEGLVEVETTDTDNSEKIQATGFAITAGLVADDISGIGTIDDIAIPFILIGFTAAAAIDELTSETTFSFASEHRKRRGSKKKTNDKHTKLRPGRNNTKQRQNPSWKPNRNKRNK